MRRVVIMISDGKSTWPICRSAEIISDGDVEKAFDALTRALDQSDREHTEAIRPAHTKLPMVGLHQTRLVNIPED